MQQHMWRALALQYSVWVFYGSYCPVAQATISKRRMYKRVFLDGETYLQGAQLSQGVDTAEVEAAFKAKAEEVKQ
jgi:hypothetical protein